MKENFTTKLIKRFYGLTGPLDEYRKQEINQIGNYCFIFLASFLLLGNFIALLFAHHYPTQVAWIYPIVVEIAVFLAFGYVIVKTARLKLMQIDVDEFEDKELKKLKWQGLYLGGYFAIGTFFLTMLLDYVEYGTTALETLTKPKSFAQATFSGLFFGSFMHLTTKFRMRKNNSNSQFDKKAWAKICFFLIIIVYLFRFILNCLDTGQINLARLLAPKELILSSFIGLGFGTLLYFAKKSSQNDTDN